MKLRGLIHNSVGYISPDDSGSFGGVSYKQGDLSGTVMTCSTALEEIPVKSKTFSASWNAPLSLKRTVNNKGEEKGFFFHKL